MINKKFSGEMTIEAALVMPVIIVITIALIYMALNIHDSISLKSSMYSMCLEIENDNNKYSMDELVKGKIRMAPVFATSLSNVKVNEAGEYRVQYTNEFCAAFKWIDMLVRNEDTKTVKNVKKMSINTMYICKVICDGLK